MSDRLVKDVPGVNELMALAGQAFNGAVPSGADGVSAVRSAVAAAAPAGSDLHNITKTQANFDAAQTRYAAETAEAADDGAFLDGL